MPLPPPRPLTSSSLVSYQALLWIARCQGLGPYAFITNFTNPENAQAHLDLATVNAFRTRRMMMMTQLRSLALALVHSKDADDDTIDAA